MKNIVAWWRFRYVFLISTVNLFLIAKLKSKFQFKQYWLKCKFIPVLHSRAITCECGGDPHRHINYKKTVFR